MGNVYQDIHKEIIALSKAGNTKAQYELYSLYAKAMFNICMRLLNSRENAEDALQEAFCEIFVKLETFRFESSFGAWAKRIVINTCLNKLRKKTPDMIFTEDITVNQQEKDENTDCETIKYQVHQIRKAISMLPEGYRIILTLFLMEGYNHNEISEILGISISTSKSQYMKAKRKVKKIIDEKL